MRGYRWVIFILVILMLWGGLALSYGSRCFVGASASIHNISPQFESSEQGILLEEGNVASFSLLVDRHDSYQLELSYRIPNQSIVKPTLRVEVDGSLPSPQWENIQLQPLWFEKGERLFDRNNNEITPQQASYDGWQNMVLHHTGLYSYTPLIIELAPGQHTVTIKNLANDVIVGELNATVKESIPSYADYSSVFTADEGYGLFIVEGEAYAYKTDSTIRSTNIQNTSVLPFDPDKKLLNAIDEDSFAKCGQGITWQVQAPEDGYYHIGLKYRTSGKQNATSYRNLLVDNKLLFSELQNIALPFTGDKWSNFSLTEASDTSTPVYLTKGSHYITLQATATPIEVIGSEVEEIMTRLSGFTAQLIKIAGDKTDTLRTWDIEQYIPGAVSELQRQVDRLEALYEELYEQNGKRPTYAEGLLIAAAKIKDVLKQPNKIPSRVKTLTEGDTSAAKQLGDVLQQLYLQPLSIDRLYLLGRGENMPSPDAPLLSGFFYGSRSFLRSFYQKAEMNDPKALKVWANLPLPYIELLQQMCDTRYTPVTNTKIDISTMPNDQKLILSNAAGVAPDIALGLPSGRPFNYGIRGAVKDLAQFPDFYDFVNDNFEPETIVPYRLNDKVFGITEAQDFYVLFYRTDIMEALGLAPPDTWEDVQKIMPKLTRNSKSFYIPAAGWSGYKPFYTTTPFIYQAGGQVYQENAASVSFSDQRTLAGLTVMTDLFRIYSLPTEIPNFYNDFRYGKVPIGVSNFSTYVWLMSAAPELAGKWAIAPSPGMRNEDGEVVRYQIAADRAAVILEQTDKPNEAWDFLKWWLSTETQLDYGTSLQINLGPAFMWNTANLKAFSQLPFRQADKEVILDQWRWIKELPPHPAAYMAERSLSDLWNDVVLGGQSVRLAADRNSVDVNREILLKLEEFGFYKDGKMVVPYDIREWRDEE